MRTINATLTAKLEETPVPVTLEIGEAMRAGQTASMNADQAGDSSDTGGDIEVYDTGITEQILIEEIRGTEVLLKQVLTDPDGNSQIFARFRADKVHVEDALRFSTQAS